MMQKNSELQELFNNYTSNPGLNVIESFNAKVLNITDSLFDLRTILEYLDGLFKDLEKEKSARREFDINNEAFSNKVKKLEKLFKDIYYNIIMTEKEKPK